MKKLYVISKSPILIQKLRLGLSDWAIITVESVEEAMGEKCLIDLDSYPDEARKGFITVGAGGELPYPFSFSSLIRLLEREAREDCPLLYPLADGIGISLNGERINLTEVEMRLFTAIYNAQGLISREELLNRVWGAGADGGVLNVYIHYLRTKLEASGEKVIIASRGRGYGISDKYRRKKDAEAD